MKSLELFRVERKIDARGDLKNKTFSCTLEEQVPMAGDVWQEILAFDNSISSQTGTSFWRHNKCPFPLDVFLGCHYPCHHLDTDFA